jgi:hypothetical protein
MGADTGKPTDEGINALFSLKAARDSLNTNAGRYQSTELKPQPL